MLQCRINLRSNGYCTGLYYEKEGLCVRWKTEKRGLKNYIDSLHDTMTILLGYSI